MKSMTTSSTFGFALVAALSSVLPGCARQSRQDALTAARQNADSLRPPWVDGYCERRRYLCGVGSAESVEGAEVKARKNLTLIFEANIRSVAESFQSASQTISDATGESWTEVQRVQEYSMVSTDRALETSDIIERWDDGQGTIWALAVVDRAQRTQALRQQIGTLDGTVQTELQRAEEADSQLQRLAPLRRALAALAERSALEADLRVVDPSGRGAPGQYTPSEVAALLEATRAQLQIGLSVVGQGASKVAGCLEKGLTRAGHEIATVEVDERSVRPITLDGAFDVRIEAVVDTEAMGTRDGTHTIKAILEVRLINGQNGKILRTVTGSELGTRPSPRRAINTAAAKVCKKQVPSMVKGIDQAFGR